MMHLCVAYANSEVSDASQKQHWLTFLQNNFQKFHTWHATFSEKQEDGVRSGQLWIKNPGCIRVQYDDGQLLLSNGNGSLVTYMPGDDPLYVDIQDTPLSIWTSHQQKLEKICTVRHVFVDQSTHTVTLFMHHQPSNAMVHLTFLDNPFYIQRWTLTVDGYPSTTVEFYHQKFDEKFDDEMLFVFRRHQNLSGHATRPAR